MPLQGIWSLFWGVLYSSAPVLGSVLWALFWDLQVAFHGRPHQIRVQLRMVCRRQYSSCHSTRPCSRSYSHDVLSATATFPSRRCKPKTLLHFFSLSKSSQLVLSASRKILWLVIVLPQLESHCITASAYLPWLASARARPFMLTSVD